MLSNGPGDPKDVPEAIEMIKELLEKSSTIRNLLRTSIVCSCYRCEIQEN